MQYVLLIHAAESRFATMTQEAVGAVMQAYGDFTRDLMATGRAGDCAALEATHTATTVRVREGRRAVQDGPFAETREQLGGYYTLRAETEEEALAWAAKIPDARGGSIEVRPVIGMPAVGAAASPMGVPAGESRKQYILLIYESAAAREGRSESDRQATFGRYLALSAELRASGQMIAGDPLDGVAKARTVSLRGGERVVRDGPFAETREQLGGYYRVWARDLDEAIALAARIPAAETGTIEVRPVADTSAYA
ncbi:MAG: hypothetical protein JWM10_1570 [Myxococcaceae bacterium]|nr:hypothetical protein [Myxococcaceae bacterium]